MKLSQLNNHNCREKKCRIIKMNVLEMVNASVHAYVGVLINMTLIIISAHAIMLNTEVIVRQ